MNPDGSFTKREGIFVANPPPVHRDEEYNPSGFSQLVRMQREHFWYQGRHAVLLSVLHRVLERASSSASNPPIVDGSSYKNSGKAIDLGGGCGGWIEYLHQHAADLYPELALADSSLDGLRLAAPVVEPFAQRYHVDLAKLPWRDHWDAAFLLDVIEHLDDDVSALRQAALAVRPGGWVMVSVPALQFFWTYNDVVAQHRRRYSAKDMPRLAQAAGLNLICSGYFMFLLSPLLLLSRMMSRPAQNASIDAMRAHARDAHRIPVAPLNALLAQTFRLEAHLTKRLHFPWGTSLYALFRKPD